MGVLGENSVFGIQAEAMVAVQAMQVVEDGLIHKVAKRGANGPSGNATDEPPQKSPRNASKNRAGGACESANGSTDTGTRCGCGYTRGDTGNGADSTADLATMVGCLDF